MKISSILPLLYTPEIFRLEIELVQRKGDLYLYNIYTRTNDKNGVDVINHNKTVMTKRNTFCIGRLYYKL